MLVPSDELADSVSVMVVPFAPAPAGESSDLVCAATVPRLCNDFRVAEHRVFGDSCGERAACHQKTLLVSGEFRGKVKAESVNVHLKHPVAQTFDDEVGDNGVVRVHGVSAAREVHVVFRVVVDEMVEDCVVKPAEIKRDSAFVSFRRVVENHVEDDFDSGVVERLHHVLELAHRAPGRLVKGIARLWREKSDGGIAPVVLEPCPCARICVRVLVLVEFKNRKQLHRGDSKLLQVRDFFRKPQIRSWMLNAACGRGREALQVKLVDYRLVERRFKRLVVFPVVVLVVYDDALWGF